MSQLSSSALGEPEQGTLLQQLPPGSKSDGRVKFTCLLSGRAQGTGRQIYELRKVQAILTEDWAEHFSALYLLQPHGKH